MFSSIIGKSKGISKKFLCVLMTISLSLMMLPTSIFKTEANANPVTDSLPEKNGIVKSDSDMTKFGTFEYNASQPNGNVYTYTNNDLLNLITCKAESLESIQSSAEAEVKKALIDNGFTYIDGSWPAVDAGYTWDFTKIESVTSNLASLAVAPIVEKQNIENNLVDVITGWNFATGNPVSEVASGQVNIKATYAKWVANYKVALKNKKNLALTPLTINTNLVTGSIALAPLPTNEVDTYGNPYYNVTVNLQIKNIAKELNTFNVSVKNIVTSTTNINETNTQNLPNTNSNISGGVIFASDPISTDKVYGDTLNFSGLDLFFSEEIDPDNYKFEASTNSPDYLNVAFDSENHEYSVTCKNSYSGGSALTAKLEAWKKTAAKGDPALDTFTVTINKISKIDLGEVTLNTDIGDFSMRELDGDLGQKATVEKSINDTYKDKWDSIDSSEKISLKVVSRENIFSNTDFTLWDGGTCTVNTDKLKLFIGQETEPTENYDVTFTEGSNKLTISEPEKCTFAEFCDGKKTVPIGSIDKACFANREISVTSGQSLLCKWINGKKDGDFSESISYSLPISKRSGTIRCSSLVKEAYGVLSKINVDIRIDTTKPSYNSYTVNKVGEKGKDWEFVDDFSIIDYVLNIFNVIFTKNDINIDLDITDPPSGWIPVSTVQIYDGRDSSQNRSFIGEAKKNSSGKWVLVLSNDAEYDMSSWYVDIRYGAYLWLEEVEYSFIPEGSSEEITKIVKDTVGPEGKISVGWVDNTSHEKIDIKAIQDGEEHEMEKLENDATLNIRVSDEFFKYSYNEKSTDMLISYNYTKYNYSTQDITTGGNSINYGDFKKVTDENEKFLYYEASFNTSDIPNDLNYDDNNTLTTFSVTTTPVQDVLHRGEINGHTYSFLVNRAHPIVDIEWKQDHGPKNDKYFNCTRTATIEVTCYSGVFDPESMKIYKEVDEDGSWIDLFIQDDSNPLIYKQDIVCEAEGKYKLLITKNNSKVENATDCMGHAIEKQLSGTDSEFTIDLTNPKVTNIEFTDTERVVNDKYFQLDKREATVSVLEKYSWNPGTKNIQNSENKITLGSDLRDQDDGTHGKYNLSDWSSEPDSKYKYDQTITFVGDGIYYLYINGEDLAGNPVEYNGATTSVEYIKLGQEFVLDKTQPIIENPKWNSATPKNEIYYNTGRSLYIEIKENNFEDDAHPNDFTPDVKVIDENGRDISSQAYTFSGWNKGTGATHYGNFNFVLEGDFTVIVDGKDLAYNDMNNPFNSGLFTQDWTAPTFTSITWDNDNVINGMYYSAARNVSISVYEHNFRASDFPITPSIIPGNDGTIGSFYIDQWADSSNYHNSGVSFPTEGNYTISVEGVDLAGNAIAPYVQSEFVLDWTKPTIQISGVENRQACGDVAQPSVVINDANMSTQTTCSVESLGVTKGHPYSASPVTTPAQFNYDYANPEKIADNDGVYRINVNAVDMAGNGDIQERVWSVNRFGSTYVIDADTESIMDGYVGKDKMKDIVVTEINPSGVDSHSVDLTKGSFTETLKEGSDYTTNATGGDGSWYECVYTISKNFFKEDGKYTLNYYSKDKAGNENENTMENKNADRTGNVNIQFMFDNAKPSVSYDNLSDYMYSEAVHKATAVFEDNSKKFSEAKVIINGDEKYVSGDDLEKDKFKVNFELPDSSTPYTIETVSIDKAGNEMNKDTKTVVVTMNPFLLWFYNTPLFIGSLIALGIVIAGLVFFLYRRKRLS